MMQRVRNLGAIVLSLLLSGSLELPQAQAQAPGEVQTPPGFASATAKVNGTVLHYVRGGKGPPVILLHGFPQEWSEYRAIMPRLSQRFTVVAALIERHAGAPAHNK
jgi:hypothetical protein